MSVTKLHIIAVDDEKDLNVLFKHFFRNEIKSNKLLLNFADNAKQCLELLANIDRDTRVIVLTDINMPDVSGIELTKQINQTYPNVEVFLVTAYEKDHIDKSLNDKIQINGIIHKPIDFNRLKSDINL